MKETPTTPNVPPQDPTVSAKASNQPPPSPRSHSFSSSEALKFGFDIFKKNIVTFIKIAAVLLIINIVMGAIGSLFGHNNPLVLIWGIISYLIAFVIQIGIVKMILDLYDGKPLNFSNLYTQYALGLRYYAASIIYGIMVLVGLICLIVPGIYLAIRFQFFSFLIVDKNAGIAESLSKSSALTEGVKINLFLFALLIVVINIIGFLLLGIGLLVTIPTTMMATIHVYRKLLSQTPGI